MKNIISSNHCYEKCYFQILTDTLESVLTGPEGKKRLEVPKGDRGDDGGPNRIPGAREGST